MALVEVDSVCKEFGGAKVLKDVTLSLDAGLIHGVVGRNGSGKTVLFKCICGLLAYDGGTIAVNGEVVGRDVEIPNGIGLIIESPGFLPHKSAFANLVFLARLSGKADKDDVRRALRTAGLDPDDKKHVGKYSMGMKQRAGIAQAIMENPSILVLDEPFNGLDKDGVADMRRLFADLRKAGKTIVMASHNPQDIDALCDTVHEMDAGVLRRIL